jgi:ketosteroid isomerase-like protein
MRRSFPIIVLLTIGLVFVDIAMADDETDVREAVMAYRNARRTGDLDVIEKSIDVESAFGWQGGLLIEGRDFSKELIKPFYDAGGSDTRRMMHLGVKVYGNSAVVTGYLIGSLIDGEGIGSQGNRRFTEVWVKKGGLWKRVHTHESELISTGAEIVTPKATDGQ